MSASHGQRSLVHTSTSDRRGSAGSGGAPHAENQCQKLRYEKGEGRKKHVGTKDHAYVEFNSSRPRHYVGKCPNNVSLHEATKLLQEAVSGANGDRELPYAKTLYAVRHGTIYELATSNAGVSYHAYPYRGKLPKLLVETLRKRSVNEGYGKAFESWFKENITPHGSWTA